MEESISLEETNRIRISLGLKPLTDDKAPTGTEEEQAAENYRKQREREAKEREAKRVAEGIAKVKNKRELYSSLKGTTLGDPDGDEEDTLKWIKKSKKKQKLLAQKKQEELAKMDQEFLGEYTERDLEGIKVAHDLDVLNEGEEKILTLKDSRILEEEEDELENVALAGHERTKKNNELKIKKRDYTGYDDDEFGQGTEGMKKRILAKYDDEMDDSSLGFRLGASRPAQPVKRQEQEQAATAVNKSLLSIDYTKNVEISDYLQEGDVGFKKPKTKKKRPSRRAPVDVELADPDSMTVDVPPPPEPTTANDTFVDDDDLQALLARERRAKMKKARLDPEEIARRIAEEQQEERANVDMEPKAEEESEGLVFDDTSEFVRAITYDPTAAAAATTQASETPAKREESMPQRSLSPVQPKEEEDDEAVLHAMQVDENDGGLEDGEEVVKPEESEMGTQSEQTYGTGMASTLAILRQQGILKGSVEEILDREKTQKEKDRWLAKHRALQARLEQDKLNSRMNRDGPAREYDNRRREQEEQRRLADSFKDYKPDVNIVYYDDNGRALSTKEAWKALSHVFHGKGSGRAKTEKLLKKIEDEQKKEAMVSGDTPLSMIKAFQTRQEKVGQAHMVLSVGNRGAAPQVADFLDGPQLSKSKADRKGKKKEGQAPAAGNETPKTPTSSAFAAAPVISAPPTTAVTAKPNFTRIGSAAPAESPTPGGTMSPATGGFDRAKVQFGLKRKADDYQSGPSSKRR